MFESILWFHILLYHLLWLFGHQGDLLWHQGWWTSCFALKSTWTRSCAISKRIWLLRWVGSRTTLWRSSLRNNTIRDRGLYLNYLSLIWHLHIFSNRLMINILLLLLMLNFSRLCCLWDHHFILAFFKRCFTVRTLFLILKWYLWVFLLIFDIYSVSIRARGEKRSFCILIFFGSRGLVVQI